jgi:protein phosphatase 2C family protein 2/3
MMSFWLLPAMVSRASPKAQDHKLTHVLIGIWDCQSSQAVVEFVRRGIAAKQELSKICENMMDNCLASNSETGGVGCDNMTMIVIGLLHGKTKEEWYEEIAKRVANGDGPCAPPEYGKYLFIFLVWTKLTADIAEFRGPGVHHNFDDSDSGYDVDMDQKIKSFGGNQRGRIILLGDGTEVLTDSDDTEMFDHGEEDKDLASQVHKGHSTSHHSSDQAAPSPDALPEKIDITDPKYKAIAEKVLSNSNEPIEKKSAEINSESKDK